MSHLLTLDSVDTEVTVNYMCLLGFKSKARIEDGVDLGVKMGLY